MHSSVSNHNESTRADGEPNDVWPQATVVESKSAEDGGAWYFDVEAVLMINQGEVLDFVDDEAFEAVMED
jgi:ketosteroid isomerase-like protein